MSKKEKVFKRIRNSAVIKNPLLFEMVGLCPVVAIALSLKLAIFVAIVVSIELIICEILSSLLLKNVRRYWRVALYVVFGIAIVFPIVSLTNKFFPELSMNMGVYLPLMAVNSIVALHCERVAVKNNVKNSLVDALSASLSYSAVTILVGFARELLASGTIGGAEVNMPVKFSALLTPFGGLLIMGFLAAGLKAFVNAKYPDASPDRAFDTSEIRRSLRGSLKELMKDEYNPYGAEETESAFIRIKKEKKAKKKLANQEATKEIFLEEKNEEEHKKETPVIVVRPQKKKDDKPKRKSKIKPSKSQRPERRTEEHSYLDDFSEMLSELDEYKKSNDSVDKNTDGGDEE